MKSLKALYEFNMLPSRYIHSSWLENTPNAAILQRLKPYAAADSYISAYLLEHYNLSQHYETDPSHELIKLISLSNTELMELVAFAGAHINAPYTQRIIERASLTNIKQVIGENAYDFSLRRSPILKTPQVSVNLEKNSHAPGQFILSCGMLCLLKSIEHFHSKTTLRLLLKLPKHYSFFKPKGFARRVEGNANALLTSLIDEIRQ